MGGLASSSFDPQARLASSSFDPWNLLDDDAGTRLSFPLLHSKQELEGNRDDIVRPALARGMGAHPSDAATSACCTKYFLRLILPRLLLFLLGLFAMQIWVYWRIFMFGFAFDVHAGAGASAYLKLSSCAC